MAIVDATGARNVQLSDIVADLKSDFREAFGDDLDLSDETPQGQIIGIWSTKLSEGCQSIVHLSNAISVSRAQGVQLDDLGSLTGVARMDATHSRVTATLAGTAGTQVPQGSRARTAAGDQFQTLDDAILSNAGVQVEMEAVQPGPIPAGVNALTSIVTIVPGWETITNASAAVLGVVGESDPRYRASYSSRTARLSQGAVPALEAGLYEAGAMTVRVEENNGNLVEIIQGFEMRPNSVLAIVEGGTDQAMSDAVARYRGMGVGPMTAIFGGAHADLATLRALNNAAIEWNGGALSIDLTSADSLERAAALVEEAIQSRANFVNRQTQFVYLGGAFAFLYKWHPEQAPTFGGANADDFGFTEALATVSPGAFIRTRTRALTIDANVSVRDGFPSDGLDQLKRAVTDRVNDYGIGEQVWQNDILCELERIPGTRVTALTVQDGSTNISGMEVPIDVRWSLPAANLTITLALA